MAWPKGKPRKPQAEGDSNQPVPAAPAAPRRQMKARPNWETYEPTEESEDRLHIPNDMFPPGFDLQWVTDSVYGQPWQSRGLLERKGWTPVHQEDFGGIYNGRFMARDKEGEINVDGMVLMARPLEISRKARAEEERKAHEVVQVKQQQLTGGDLPGVSLDSRHVSAVRSNRINITREPIRVPGESSGD